MATVLYCCLINFHCNADECGFMLLQRRLQVTKTAAVFVRFTVVLQCSGMQLSYSQKQASI